MLTAHTLRDGALERVPVRTRGDLPATACWLDLSSPSDVERIWIRETYGQELQFVEELGEIEHSTRFFRDAHGLHLQLDFLELDHGRARNVGVGFTLSGGRLFTLHAGEVTALRTFPSHAASRPALADEGLALLIGINRLRVALLADALEARLAELESLSGAVFSGSDRQLQRVLEELARIEDVNGQARIGMVENRRVLVALQQALDGGPGTSGLAEIVRDVDSLTNHSNHLFEKGKFLLDLTLGMIDIQHSKRLNIFTVLSVVLMPPTLIASIYGMNFRHMPELDWPLGYPLVVALMIAVAVGPVLWLKHKDWL